MNVVFFGSTDESLIVLQKIYELRFTNYELNISAVVTQPPRPVGRHQELMPTPVEVWAKKHNISVLSFPTDKKTPWLYENEHDVIDTISTFTPDLLVSASYGQKIPTQTINNAKYGGLNVHPSLLPRWRGADPAPWAILSGDHQTGVTIVTIAEKFDEGKIIAQKKIPILPTDTAKDLYPKLFTLGAELLTDNLADYVDGKNKGTPQGKSPTPYARRLTKQDGFVSWDDIKQAIEGKGAIEIDRKFRALDPWPGVWTMVTIDNQQKRLKILKTHLYENKIVIDDVQLEGKTPVPFQQFIKAYPLQ